MTNLFDKSRTGSSFVSVLVFFLISLMITAQAFFFIEKSAESLSEERETMQVRLKLDELAEEAKKAIKGITPHLRSISLWGDHRGVYGEPYSAFSKTMVWNNTNEDMNDDVRVFDLYYTLMNNNNGLPSIGSEWEKKEIKNLYRRIFPAMGYNYFLIRARQQLSFGRYIMYQIVVKKNSDNSLKTISFEEMFYWDVN